MGEDGPGLKRVTLTTVRNDQEEARIAIYRGTPGQPARRGALLAELALTDLPPENSGRADIELRLSLDEPGYLRAFARSPRSGDFKSLYLPPDRVWSAGVAPWTAGRSRRKGGSAHRGIAAAVFVVFGLLLLTALGYAVFRLFFGG